MAWKVAAQQGVKNFSTGENWAKGQAIGPASFNPKLWAALLAEKAVVEAEDTPLKKAPKPTPKPKQTTPRKRKTKAAN